MRKLGLDYGDSRIGLALSDPMGIIASPLHVLHRNGKEFEYLKNLVLKLQIDVIVVGLPRNMDGTLGIRAAITREFVEQLKQFVACEIVYCDERLSTVEAHNLLLEANVKKGKKDIIDKLAASIILKAYLDNPKCAIKDFTLGGF